ncbi:MAG: Tad domain-containing protein [Pseudobdellovibrio sp.]
MDNRAKKIKGNIFSLKKPLRNKNGQVGIFVALIFQVIFVFFAMLINVGLVVHHKINLQQSTDLAAYYGAMKQAEIMNVMAHVNFQIRQAWKLMTWRYRVLGTFGTEGIQATSLPSGGNPAILVRPQMSITWGVSGGGGITLPVYNPNSETQRCSGDPKVVGLDYIDVPFMCMGHVGFKDWQVSGSSDETFCKINCGHLAAVPTIINKIPSTSVTGGLVNSVGNAINTAISNANNNVQKVCERMAPFTVSALSLFYTNYIVDTQNRKNFISLLEKNLTLSEKEILDIEGNKVFQGVWRTFKNNLTEANLASLSEDKLETYNGAKSCASNMLKEITFEMLKFYYMHCNYPSTGADVRLLPLVDGDTDKNNSGFSSGALGPGGNRLFDQLSSYFGGGSVGDAQAAEIEKLFLQDGEKINTIGFEKNPWCQVYYGAKVSSEPKIPFLPLVKVKLNAISFAKPFGGSIGPWYYSKWQKGSPTGSTGVYSDDKTVVDKNLPSRTVNWTDPNLNTLRGSRELMPNYSFYVGDPRYSGLADRKIVGLYQYMLVTKNVPDPNGNSLLSSQGKQKESGPNFNKYGNPQRWPAVSAWSHLSKGVNDNGYDPLAVDIVDPSLPAPSTNPANPQNGFIRDIEISVVAPNQFDVSYYSIEPTFYENYAKMIEDNGVINKLMSATGASLNPPPEVPYDYGKPAKNNPKVASVPEDFSVRRQIEIVEKIFKKGSSLFGIYSNISDKYFTFAAGLQSSLLTSWTYLDFKKYDDFPTPEDNTASNILHKMQFATCKDVWNQNYETIQTAMSSRPPIPGNCLTGGRTGYSVKLISSDMLISNKDYINIGGDGVSGKIDNPVDPAFLQF